MSSVFDSSEILDAWVNKKKWPEIHGRMGWAANEFLREPNQLDLCCAFGLLGDRVLHTSPYVKKVVGVDGDQRSIDMGTEAGIRIPLVHMMINRETIGTLYDLIREHNITGIMARRAFPELFGEDIEFGKEVAAEFVKLGIREILVEGRVVSKRSSNPLKELEAEVAMLSDSYKLMGGGFNCAYLQAITPATST